MKKKVLITILTSPLSSKKKIEYLIKNVNNGLIHNSYDCDVTLEFITWWATKLEDDTLNDALSVLDETHERELKNYKQFLQSSVLPEFNKLVNDNKKTFDDVHNTFYKNINNIICNHTFQKDYNFSGYGAVHQFQLLTNHIRRNINYDSYIFVSSNHFLYNKGFFQGYFKKLEKYKIPFITNVPNIEVDFANTEIDVSGNKFVTLKHGNLNSFACKPIELIDFIDIKIEKVFDLKKYKNNGEKVSLGSSFANWNGACIKNYKHRINNDYQISKQDLLDTSIFPFDDGVWEPAIQFPLFLLLYCIRHPDVYDTPLIWSEVLGISVPEYSIESNSMDKYNTTLFDVGRFEPFWEPYLNQEIIFDIIGKLDERLKIKNDSSVSYHVEKTCDTLLKYLDEITYNDNRNEKYHYNYPPIRDKNINKTLTGITLHENHGKLTRYFSELMKKLF